ncbi:MAG TPA: amidohydrolase [Thermoanaerobaculia bacterium]
MKRPLILLLLALAPSVFAQTLDQRIDRELPSLLTTYRSLHEAPELSKQEAKSSAMIAARLRELGYEVAYPVGKYEEPNATCYGVVAVMKNGKGPTVLIRSDMDALPVTEATGLEYASKTAGVMHACGHDIHMTTLLGTAKILADTKSQWHGTVMLVGQPAEEVVAGAAAMLRDNIYDRFGKPDFAVALHDSPLIPAGSIGVVSGFMMSSSDSVNVTIRGVGGHGANPQLAKDPIVIASEFVVQLQTIASRERSPQDPIVVTVGSFHAGTKRNIIPDEAKLQLTIRTYKPEVREHVLAAITRIAKGVAMAAGAPEPIVEEVRTEHSEASYNDPALAGRLTTALRKNLGDKNVPDFPPLMVSEDFPRFSLGNTIPSVMFHLGAADPVKLASGAPIPGLHSSGFTPVAEPTIRTGIKAEVVMAEELLR